MDRGLKWRLSQGHPLDDYPRDRTTDALSTVLGSLVGTFSVASMIWMVVLGFAGGTVPLLWWHLAGGIAGGLAWLMFMASVGVVALWVLPLLLSLAAYRMLSRLTPALVRAIKRPQRSLQRPPARLRRVA